MTEQEAYDTLFGVLCDSKDAHYEAVSSAPRPIDWATIPQIYDVKGFATLLKDVTTRHGSRLVTWKAGSKVRICHVSNLGLIGITDDLEMANYHTYKFRFTPGDGYLTDILVVL